MACRNWRESTASRLASSGKARAIIVLDRWRSIPLAHFAPLASLPGVRLVSLQKGFGSEQVATVDFPVLDLSGRLDEVAGPFMDTAAVIRNLDLVVTADTAIAHLAGALGVPVWVALQFSPDWRWLLRPRRLSLVSNHATLPPNHIRRVAGRFAHCQGRPGTPLGNGIIHVKANWPYRRGTLHQQSVSLQPPRKQLLLGRFGSDSV